MFVVMCHAEVTWTRTGGDMETCCFAPLVPPALQQAASEHQGFWQNRQQFAETLGNVRWLEVNFSTGSKE